MEVPLEVACGWRYRQPLLAVAFLSWQCCQPFLTVAVFKSHDRVCAGPCVVRWGAAGNEARRFAARASHNRCGYYGNGISVCRDRRRVSAS